MILTITKDVVEAARASLRHVRQVGAANATVVLTASAAALPVHLQSPAILLFTN